MFDTSTCICMFFLINLNTCTELITLFLSCDVWCIVMHSIQINFHILLLWSTHLNRWIPMSASHLSFQLGQVRLCLHMKNAANWSSHQISSYRPIYSTFLGTNISHPKAVGKMSFLSHWWDMLVPKRVYTTSLRASTNDQLNQHWGNHLRRFPHEICNLPLTCWTLLEASRVSSIPDDLRRFDSHLG